MSETVTVKFSFFAIIIMHPSDPQQPRKRTKPTSDERTAKKTRMTKAHEKKSRLQLEELESHRRELQWQEESHYRDREYLRRSYQSDLARHKQFHRQELKRVKAFHDSQVEERVAEKTQKWRRQILQALGM
jgi:hypothetical protein